jgi:hypothetical protein
MAARKKAAAQPEKPAQRTTRAKPDPKPHEVTAARLNARKTPALNGEIVGVVNQGDRVEIVQTKTVADQLWAKTKAGVWHLAEHLKEL